MVNIPGYKIEQKIDESTSSIIYRAFKIITRESFVIKALKSKIPAQNEIDHLNYENEIIRHLNSDGIIKTYGVEHFHNTVALILEDFQAIALSTFIHNTKIDLDTFFTIAIKLAETLSYLHRNNIIHRNINPPNILYNPETQQVKIIDFGISTLMTQKKQEKFDPKIFPATLAYISPEQTGRMNRPVDSRSDLYSTGVIFYEMLTGVTPFQSTEPMELIHSHIAKIPVPPHQVNEEIPQAISDIVMKLLSKNAESRYKSGFGLQYDLEFCREQLHTTGKIENFVPGKIDTSDEFQISPKLYGRDKEMLTLIPAFESAGKGNQEIVFLNGLQGIGKTSIINEIEKNILKENGYYIAVSFEQSKKDMPYHAVILAFQKLINRLLMSSDEIIKFWRNKLLTELGPYINIISSVIPELEFITGKYESSPPETLHPHLLFKEAFKKLIAVFSGKEHTFVIFLDNLQWIDNTSLNLFKSLLSEAKIGYLLLIGTYTSTEINSSHPLTIIFEELKKSDNVIKNITVEPLKKPDITQLLQDSFSPASEDLSLFSSLLYEKTQGNPYQLNKFLNYLYEEKLIVFNLEKRCWYWNLEDIKSGRISEINVEAIIEKIRKFPENTQHLLKMAACLGPEFYFNDLVIVSGKSEVETFRDLSKAVNEGLIMILEEKNKFRNEKHHEAAYSLIPAHNRATIHYKIGRLLLQNIKEEEINEKVFDIVGHFSHGINYIDQRDKNKLAELNLIAGKKSKAAGEYELALKHFTTGMSFLAKNSWKYEHDLTFSLYLERAECEYLAGNFNEAEESFAIAVKNSNSEYEKTLLKKIYNSLYENDNSTEKNELIKNIPDSKNLAEKTADRDRSFGLDYTTVMKAFQTLSAEILLDKLLDKLMKIVIENAGAQKGFMILKNKDNLLIEAERSVNMEETKVRESLKLEDSNSLSHSIINYVARTLQDVVLNDAINEGLFTADAYIVKNKPKSILCTPIIKQSQLVGILYLENNLTIGAFTSDRLEILKLLSSQAAISLENARLYDEMKELNTSLAQHKNHLEEMVEDRTKQLKETQEKLLDSAHKAGMAEIATGVLHNVGNILNSLSVSSEIIIKTLEKSELEGLTQANKLLSKNLDNIADFIANTPKGKKLAQFYLSVGDMMVDEHQTLKNEATSLMEKISITKNVVSTQQSYARAGFLVEKVNLADIVESSVSIQLGSLVKHGIQVQKIFNQVPDIVVQKTKLLHVLMNIIKNGKEAMEENELENKIISIEIGGNKETIYIKISDNGKGVKPENLNKIFNHGFTTKDDGHGFGLHTCANAMTEMGGSIKVFSEGLGKGATFVLEFPARQE
jgi:serine/threonine protein kinase/signal transduction histidine kinase